MPSLIISHAGAKYNVTASRIVITRDLGLEDGREGENSKISVYLCTVLWLSF